MAPLIRFDAVSVAFGDQKILVEATLNVEAGERVCLIGRNDAGKIEHPKDLRWSLLDQALAEESHATAREFVALGMARQLERIARFDELTATKQTDKSALREIESLQREIDAAGGWSVDVPIDRIASELG